MIVVMRKNASQYDIDNVVKHLEGEGLRAHLSMGVERTIVGVVGKTYPELRDYLERLPGVDSVIPVSKPYKLASREFNPLDTLVRVGDVVFGGPEVVVIAGPCTIENEAQAVITAKAVAAAGAKVLRGGAFKPRSSPHGFRGLQEEGLRILATARVESGLPIVTEVLTPADVELVARYSDMLQIGARNAQNFSLLEEAARAGKPILLKRGMGCTVEEMLLCAEYVLNQGNDQVVLCERGIRTFETATRFTMDLAAVPLTKQLSHLPVIADPSHGTGKWYLVKPMALAAVAAGADGLIVEVHPQPDQALIDGSQSLDFESFGAMMSDLSLVARAVRRTVGAPARLQPVA